MAFGRRAGKSFAPSRLCVNPIRPLRRALPKEGFSPPPRDKPGTPLSRHAVGKRACFLTVAPRDCRWGCWRAGLQDSRPRRRPKKKVLFSREDAKMRRTRRMPTRLRASLPPSRGRPDGQMALGRRARKGFAPSRLRVKQSYLLTLAAPGSQRARCFPAARKSIMAARRRAPAGPGSAMPRAPRESRDEPALQRPQLPVHQLRPGRRRPAEQVQGLRAFLAAARLTPLPRGPDPLSQREGRPGAGRCLARARGWRGPRYWQRRTGSRLRQSGSPASASRHSRPPRP
jgi:hypothetical protein